MCVSAATAAKRQILLLLFFGNARESWHFRCRLFHLYKAQSYFYVRRARRKYFWTWKSGTAAKALSFLFTRGKRRNKKKKVANLHQRKMEFFKSPTRVARQTLCSHLAVDMKTYQRKSRRKKSSLNGNMINLHSEIQRRNGRKRMSKHTKKEGMRNQNPESFDLGLESHGCDSMVKSSFYRRRHTTPKK